MKKFIGIISIALVCILLFGCGANNTAQVKIASKKLTEGLDNIIVEANKIEEVDENKLDISNLLGDQYSSNGNEFSSSDTNLGKRQDINNYRKRRALNFEVPTRNRFAKNTSAELSLNSGKISTKTHKNLNFIAKNNNDYGALYTASNNCTNKNSELSESKKALVGSCNDAKNLLQTLLNGKASVSESEIKTLNSYNEVISQCLSNLKNRKSCGTVVNTVSNKKVNLASNCGSMTADYLQIYNTLDANCTYCKDTNNSVLELVNFLKVLQNTTDTNKTNNTNNTNNANNANNNVENNPSENMLSLSAKNQDVKLNADNNSKETTNPSYDNRFYNRTANDQNIKNDGLDNQTANDTTNQNYENKFYHRTSNQNDISKLDNLTSTDTTNQNYDNKFYHRTANDTASPEEYGTVTRNATFEGDNNQTTPADRPNSQTDISNPTAHNSYRNSTRTDNQSQNNYSNQPNTSNSVTDYNKNNITNATDINNTKDYVKNNSAISPIETNKATDYNNNNSTNSSSDNARKNSCYEQNRARSNNFFGRRIATPNPINSATNSTNQTAQNQYNNSTNSVAQNNQNNQTTPASPYNYSNQTAQNQLTQNSNQTSQINQNSQYSTNQTFQNDATASDVSTPSTSVSNQTNKTASQTANQNSNNHQINTNDRNQLNPTQNMYKANQNEMNKTQNNLTQDIYRNQTEKTQNMNRNQTERRQLNQNQVNSNVNNYQNGNSQIANNNYNQRANANQYERNRYSNMQNYDEQQMSLKPQSVRA